MPRHFRRRDASSAAGVTTSFTICAMTISAKRSGTKMVPLRPDHHYEIEKHIGKGYPGVTRENAHLDFVRQKARSANLTLQRIDRRRPGVGLGQSRLYRVPLR